MPQKLKELYFSQDIIEAKAKDMLQAAKAGRKCEKFSYKPENSALLVLDMQSFFLDGSSHAFVPSGRTIIQPIRMLSEAYFSRGLPVIFTRHVNTPDNAQLMASWWRETIPPDNPLSRIVPEFDQSRGIVLDKNQYDAFYKTRLEDLLREKEVSQVLITGVMTHLCCETTARSAFMRGFEVFFLVDGTATYNEVFHRASLTNLSHGFAELKLVSEIMDAVQGHFHG
jgi:isochorismate hydrolase